MKLTLGQGAEVTIRDRIRTTELAELRQKAPAVIDKIQELTDTGGQALRITEKVAGVIIGGWPLDVVVAVQEFLAKIITNIEGLDADSGEPIDWRALTPEERIDAIDLLFTMLDVVTLFTTAWIQYSMGTARVRKG